jgi:hypothetical protein
MAGIPPYNRTFKSNARNASILIALGLSFSASLAGGIHVSTRSVPNVRQPKAES